MEAFAELWNWVAAHAAALWEWVVTSLAGFRNWFDKPEISNAFWPALLAGLFLLAFSQLLPRVTGRLPSLLTIVTRRRRDPIETTLSDYRDSLTAHSLELRHAWMKEGQTLGDIMVPVSVAVGGDGEGIENLAAALTRLFSDAQSATGNNHAAQPPAPRIAIIGGPGSGKSVALRLIARDGWGLPRPRRTDREPEGLIPVLLSFAELRNQDFALIPALAVALAKYGLRAPPGDTRPDAMAAWIRSALHDGRLLVLIDALDELDRDQRARATQMLNTALDAWPHAPFVVSCRTAAWQDQIQDPRRSLIEMAPFPPAAIRRFVRRWRFEPPKSADELLGVIRRQPHVAELARNPLTLTIICFLYAQPKYRLPDNRAQFYEVCARALLEEWDQAQGRERANRFDRPHKEHLLAALAFTHIAGERPDQDIDEDEALTVLADEMERHLGLRRADNHRLLDEIIQNAGLLVRLPPSGLRFPHQTFLEYFAAQQLLATQEPAAVLARYTQDPRRWREVLLLYCGLCTRPETVARILDHLRERGELGLALTALTEARVADPAAAGRILDAAETALQGDQAPDEAVIAGLGYVAANPLTSYGPRAAKQLHGLLRDQGARLPQGLLQTLLLAALRQPSAALTDYVVTNLEHLELGRILPAMAEDTLIASAGVLHQSDIPLAKKLEWIDGLRRAQAVEPLLELGRQHWPEEALNQAIGIALARCSTLDDFWPLVDQEPPAQPVGGAIDAEIDPVLQGWGWPYAPPETEHGRRLCGQLALCLSRDLSEARMDGVHPRLQYLACALAREREPSPGWDWAPAKDIATGRPGTLKAIWTRAGNPRWSKWVRQSRDFISIVIMAANSLVSLLLMVSIITNLAGWGDLGIPWHPLFSASIIVGGLFAGVIESFIEKTKPSLKDLTFWGLIPVLMITWVVTDAIAALVGEETGGRRSRLSVRIWIGVALVLPLILLVGTPAGPVLQVPLFLLLVLNPLFGLLWADFATSPVVPSWTTHELFSRLQRKQSTDTDLSNVA